MAGKKETPRQKLIGMMYLVLMAMLALNVSVSVLDAFVVVDDGLTKTTQNFSQQNNATYREFAQRYAENPDRVKRWKDKADEVRLRSDELFDNIQDLKQQIVIRADGENTTAIAEDGRIIGDNLRAKESTNPPAQVMLSEINPRATQLKNAIRDYREFLLGLVNEADEGVRQSIESSLNTSDPPPKEGATVSWESHHFYYMPTIASLALMSGMQADVRNAEADVITYLLNQIDAGSFMFNALEAITIPRSNYIFRGDEFEASVFLAAFDTTQAPEVLVGRYERVQRDDGTTDYRMVGNYQEIPVEHGRGVYRLRPGTTGYHNWGGLVRLRAPDGSIISRPFSSEYQVAEPSLIVSPSKMNVFYTGIENPVEISIPGLPADQITATVNNGTILRISGSNYVVVPGRTGEAQVSVTARINGSSRNMGSRPFRVRAVPDPVAMVANRKGGNIDRNVLLAQTGVLAVMENFDFDLTFRVTSFTVSTTQRGFVVDARSENNQINERQREIIRQAGRGDRVYFEDIMAVSPTGDQRRLPTVSFRID
jgi:gliding motility-associated protein GldM